MSGSAFDLKASLKLLNLFENAKSQVESILDEQQGIFVILDVEGNVLRSNKYLATLYGLHQNQMLYVNFSRLFGQHSWQNFANKIKSIRAGDRYTFESPILEGLRSWPAKLGMNEIPQLDFWWTMTTFEVPDRKSEKFIAVFGQDITQLRRKERELSMLFATVPIGIISRLLKNS